MSLYSALLDWNSSMKKRHVTSAAFLMIATFGSPAGASPDGGDATVVTDAEALAQDAKAYARAYNVSFEEASRRMLLMHDSEGQTGQINAANAGQLAGSYFDHANGFEYVVRVTGKAGQGPNRLERRAARAEAKAARKALIDAEKEGPAAERRRERLAAKGLSEQQLAVAEQMIDTAQSAPVEFKTDARKVETEARRTIKDNRKAIATILGIEKFGYGYNVRTGEYRVMVTAQGAEAQRLAAKDAELETLLGGPVDLEVSNVPTTIEHTRGGAALNATATSTGHSCTAGFVGYEGTDRTRLGLLTAAHCGNSYYFKNPYDGSNYLITVPAANRDAFNAGMDMQWMTAAHVAEGKFYADNTSSPRTVTGYRSRANTSDTGVFGTADGSFICHYGKTTGQSCGEVYDKWAAPDYSGNGCSNGPSYVACDDEFVEVHNKVVTGETQLACFGGDSGGPWFAYSVAFGIHSGGSKTGSAPGQCIKAYYTPIEKAANINATIYIP